MIINNKLSRALKVCGIFLLPGETILSPDEIAIFEASRDFAARLKSGSLQVKKEKLSKVGEIPSGGEYGPLGGLSAENAKEAVREILDVNQLLKIEENDPRRSVRNQAAAKIQKIREALEDGD